MTREPGEVVQQFEAAAEMAHRAETEYAKQFEIELGKRKRAREFAFRRLNLIRELMRSAPAETQETSVAAQTGCLCRELGWHSASEATDKVLEEFRAFAGDLHAAIAEPEAKKKANLLESFARFEAWYEQEKGVPFLALFDNEIPEMPLVDF
jgi:hypothetical protein